MLNKSAFWLAIIVWKKDIGITLKVYYNPSGGDHFCAYIGDDTDRPLLFNSQYCETVAGTYTSLADNIKQSTCSDKEKFLTPEFLHWLQKTLATLDG